MPTWSNSVGGPLRDDQIIHLVNFVVNWEQDSLTQTAEEDPWQCYRNAPTKVREGDESPEALQIKICGPDGTSALPGEPLPVAEEVVPSEGPRDPATLFVSMGCAGCHNMEMDQTANDIGQPGPYMRNLYETAGTRVEGQDAATYVYNSIVNPNEYLNEGYISGLMPQNFADLMSEEEIQGMVDWLLDPNRQQ